MALALGIPMYGADPRSEQLGTKSGCRRLFRELGVRCPAGAEDLHHVDELLEAVAMRAAHPLMSEAIVKLDEGVSGAGNALLDLRDLPPPGAADETDRLRARQATVRPEAPGLDADTYLELFGLHGGIVEERILGRRIVSPSVQMRVLPDGSVELLSTHDQLLGGPSGQQYVGCVFPADPAYSRLITAPALRVGRRLAEHGVLGRFAVDFVVVEDDTGGWTPYAIELNLRKGGTTHPFLTLQFLTEGGYDGEAGEYRTARGDRKHLVATDHLEDPRLTALTVDDLFNAMVVARLHFDQATQTGVVLHMLSCVTECGRTGLTAVGDTAEQAWELYQRATAAVLHEAELALGEGVER